MCRIMSDELIEISKQQHREILAKIDELVKVTYVAAAILIVTAIALICAGAVAFIIINNS